MPCLNEEEIIAACIKKAKFFEKNNINGKMLISDNGSTDKSVGIAELLGARVVNVKRKGYGRALIAGSENTHGKYVITGNADYRYDFANLMPFVENCVKAMPLLHR